MQVTVCSAKGDRQAFVIIFHSGILMCSQSVSSQCMSEATLVIDSVQIIRK